MMAGRLVKCVVWDIDNTLLSGVYLESPGAPPEPAPGIGPVLATLAGRGILHAIASKNPPEAAARAAQALGSPFAAVRCGWGRKPDAVAQIAAELGIGADALAFVDDDPYERAEVASVLPQVMVLSPEDAVEAVDWPEFSPPEVTAEGRRRGELYAARRRRQEAEQAFGGSREDFLRSVGTSAVIAPATAADAPRLHELALRTRQFNSATADMGREDFESAIAAGGIRVVTVRVRDRFGDDGLVGGCVLDTSGQAWSVRLLMMSCRAMGRGVIGALLAWLAREAARRGASTLRVPCVLNERNVPLRLALAGAGFQAAAATPSPPGAAVFTRDLTGPLPALPGWVTTAPGGQAGEPA